MTEEEFRSVFKGQRCYQYDGVDINALFRWFNMLISDASSYLIQCAPTRNPIMCLRREDDEGLDKTIKEDVF